MSEDYGFFTPAGTAAPPAQPGVPAQPSVPAPFGTSCTLRRPGARHRAAPARSGLPAWAIVLISRRDSSSPSPPSVALPAFLSGRQHSRLAATSVVTPAAADQSSALRRPRHPVAGRPAGGRHTERLHARTSAGYAGGSSTLLVAAAKPQHVLTLAEQESLTRSFWANEAASVPDGSSLAAPSTPAGAGATGTLTCADEITADGAATVCIDAQATARGRVRPRPRPPGRIRRRRLRSRRPWCTPADRPVPYRVTLRRTSRGARAWASRAAPASG